MNGRGRVQLSAWTVEINMGSWQRECLYLCATGLPPGTIGLPPGTPSARAATPRAAVSTAVDAVWAEVAPLDGYGQDTMGDVRMRLSAALDWLEEHLQRLPTSPDALPRSRDALPGVPSLRWGAELLVAKLAARGAGMPLGVWLGGRADTCVPTAGLILRGDTPLSGATTAEPQRVVKLKIGPYADPEDAARIRELAAARADIRIRLDANRNGSPASLLRLLESIQDIGHCIDFIEEPFPVGESIPAELGFALAADETLREASWASVDPLAALPSGSSATLLSRADVWIIKPSLHGGLTEVLDCLEAARSAGRRVVWSSAWESGVGMADLREVASLWPDEAAGFGTQHLMPHQVTEPESTTPAVCPVAFMATHAPDRVAIRLADHVLTYGEFHERISGAAARLAHMQLPAGAAVAARADRSTAFCEVLFAAMRLGLRLLPVNTRLPEHAQEELVAKAGAVWVGARALHRPESFARRRAKPKAGLEHMTASMEHVTAGPEHMAAGGAVLVATSGSTGAPRTVILDWARMLGHARLVNTRTGFTATHSWAWSLPPWHVGGLAIPVRCAVAGGTLVADEWEGVRGGGSDDGYGDDGYGDGIGATHGSMVPTQLDRLLRKGAAPMTCMLLGGGPVPQELLRRAVNAGLPIRTTWGMTEAGSMISCSEVWTQKDVAGLVKGAAPRVQGAAPRVQGAVPPVHAGVPLPGIRVTTLEGGAGKRLEVHSPWAARAHDHLVTSDAGYVDAEGRIVVEGRLDRVFISGGENIDPAVIEQALVALPGVESARVVGIPHAEFGHRPIAFVRRRAATGEGSSLGGDASGEAATSEGSSLGGDASGEAVTGGGRSLGGGEASGEAATSEGSSLGGDASGEAVTGEAVTGEELRRRLRASLPGYMIPDVIYEEPTLPEGRVKWTEQELVTWAERRR